MRNNYHTMTLAALLGFAPLASMAQNTPTGQMEKLGRGVIAVPASSGGELVSWRFLGTDDEDRTTFQVLRNGTNVSGTISNSTNYRDASGTSSSRYQVVTLVDGVAQDTTDYITPWSNIYKTMKLDHPAGTSSYGYTPNDCSVGDLDGDGEYELVVKWDPSNSKDNSNSGKTGNVYLDAYKLDGTKLWRLDLGVNIRAGAHYTQFLVYDFDGDGKAELICKTAPGSIDGEGNYVTAAATDESITSADNSADYRNSSGRILTGPEYLSVFNGETGKAVHTIFYRPNRGFGFSGSASLADWGDSYANRADRFLATVAYLDGPDENPSAVMCRGYYTRAYLWAVGFDGTTLSTKWVHGSISNNTVNVWDSNDNVSTYTYSSNTANKGSYYTAYGNGNHNLSCADVDGDGKDEIIYGQCAVDDDGMLLYSVGYGHGDAMHLTDLLPDRPGLEVFCVHEKNVLPYGWDIHDAATGEVIHYASGSSDNGRGLAADIDADNRGFEFWSSNDGSLRSAVSGEVVSSNSVSVNFRMYWDADLQDELLDDNKLDKYSNGSASRLVTFYNYVSANSCNSTKATPNLMADILGDWREEVILWSSGDSATLNIFSTPIVTSYRVPTLMHDHTYRMGITWQQTAYNQPPHLGYYLPDRFLPKVFAADGGELEQTVTLGDSISPVVLRLRYCNLFSSKVDSTYLPDGTEVAALYGEFSSALNYADKTITISGLPTQTGDYTIVVKGVASESGVSPTYGYVTIHVLSESDGIEATVADDNAAVEIYNMAGIRQRGDFNSLPRGVYVVKRGGVTTKVLKQ